MFPLSKTFVSSLWEERTHCFPKRTTFIWSLTTPKPCFIASYSLGLIWLLAHMDHPDSSHPIFHFTTQIPLSSSLHPLHILPHPCTLLFLAWHFLQTAPRSFLLTSSSPCCLIFSCLLHSSLWPLDLHIVCRRNKRFPSNPTKIKG